MIAAWGTGLSLAVAFLVWTSGAHRGPTARRAGLGSAQFADVLSNPLSRLRSAVRRDTAAEAALCITLVRRLSALLHAGRAPSTVFGAVASAVSGDSLTAVHLRDVCAQVHAAAQLGLPVSVPLSRCARMQPGLRNRMLDAWVRSVYAQVAACWEVSEHSGASLARTLSGLADSLESQADAQAARDSALAGPRATVRVLAWLPVLALGLGALMGTDPISTLLTTPWGRIALAAGAALTVADRVWTTRLLHRAEGEPT